MRKLFTGVDEFLVRPSAAIVSFGKCKLDLPESERHSRCLPYNRLIKSLST